MDEQEKELEEILRTFVNMLVTSYHIYEARADR